MGNQEAGTQKGSAGCGRESGHTAVVVWTPGGWGLGGRERCPGLASQHRETVFGGGHGGYNFFGKFGKDQL